MRHRDRLQTQIEGHGPRRCTVDGGSPLPVTSRPSPPRRNGFGSGANHCHSDELPVRSMAGSQEQALWNGQSGHMSLPGSCRIAFGDSPAAGTPPLSVDKTSFQSINPTTSMHPGWGMLCTGRMFSMMEGAHTRLCRGGFTVVDPSVVACCIAANMKKT